MKEPNTIAAVHTRRSTTCSYPLFLAVASPERSCPDGLPAQKEVTAAESESFISHFE